MRPSVDRSCTTARPTVWPMWFIGAPLAFEVADAELVPPDAEVVPVRPGDRHVTLVFLGGVPDDSALSIWRSLPDLRLPAEVRALGWARFGQSALALELSDEHGLLTVAAGRCDSAATAVVELQRHPHYRPHVTMARTPRRSRPPSARALAGWPMPSQPIAVGAPTLYRTKPQPGSDRYERVAQQPPR